MHVSSQTQAVLLLTVALGKSRTPETKPLSPGEWAHFARWLKDHDRDPSDLLKGDPKGLLGGWTDESITPVRLMNLLERGGMLGLVLEKWERAGLWVITRADPDYPKRLKDRLQLQSPPVLFGCGKKRLFNATGIAVVGSRDTSRDDLAYTENLGQSAAEQGYAIISGAARGVDETAMLGALRCEGTAIGVMAHDLLRASASMKYRECILRGDLMLISTFNPEAGFNVGNAMARNRYIYCLSEAAVVVSSAPGKGGTWNGAIENLKAHWVPLWVQHTASAKSGNSELVQRGAHWIPEELPPLDVLLNASSDHTVTDSPGGQSQKSADGASPTATKSPTGDAERLDPDSNPATEPEDETATDGPAFGAGHDQGNGDCFYGYFLQKMEEAVENGPLKRGQIIDRWNLAPSQVGRWLQRGVEDGKLKEGKRKTASTYISVQGQPSLLDKGR